MQKQSGGGGRWRVGYNTVADAASLLIHGVLRRTEIGGNPCKGGEKSLSPC